MDNVLSYPALNLLSGGEKASLLTTIVKQFTSQSQAPSMSITNRFVAGATATPFYASNIIAIKDVNLPLTNVLSFVPGPFNVRKEPVASYENLSQRQRYHNISFRASEGKWSPSKIEAPAIWDKFGINGE